MPAMLVSHSCSSWLPVGGQLKPSWQVIWVWVIGWNKIIGHENSCVTNLYVAKASLLSTQESAGHARA